MMIWYLVIVVQSVLGTNRRVIPSQIQKKKSTAHTAINHSVPHTESLRKESDKGHTTLMTQSRQA